MPSPAPELAPTVAAPVPAPLPEDSGPAVMVQPDGSEALVLLSSEAAQAAARVRSEQGEQQQQQQVHESVNQPVPTYHVRGARRKRAPLVCQQRCVLPLHAFPCPPPLRRRRSPPAMRACKRPSSRPTQRWWDTLALHLGLPRVLRARVGWSASIAQTPRCRRQWPPATARRLCLASQPLAHPEDAAPACRTCAACCAGATAPRAACTCLCPHTLSHPLFTRHIYPPPFALTALPPPPRLQCSHVVPLPCFFPPAASRPTTWPPCTRSITIPGCPLHAQLAS